MKEISYMMEFFVYKSSPAFIDRICQTPAGWSAEARAWAEKNGLIAGDEAGNKQYRSFLTREQMAVLMQRYDAMQHGK